MSDASVRPVEKPSRRGGRGPRRLEDPVQFLPGVGPRRGEAIARLGVRTVGDLLLYFPFRHERHEQRLIINLEPGIVATIVGQITARRGGESGFARGRGPAQAVRATITDNTGRCSVIWFNAPYVRDRIQPGAIVRLTGKVGEFGGLPQLVNPKVDLLDESAAPADESAPARLEPVYPASAELSSAAIAKLIRANLSALLPLVEEWLPESLRSRRRLGPRRESIEHMHRPTIEADVQAARRRLAYDELLALQLAVQVSRQRRASRHEARALPLTEMIDDRIRRRLPFALTAGQAAAVREIAADLGRDRPMNRLLQGDVGCGKTVVAIYATMIAVANRAQVAIMAPTELLAEQLHQHVERYLAGSRVRRALLIGGLPQRERREVLARIADGSLDVVVGTQALLEPDVAFERLGLVIVDEQHRFGVRQRALMRRKGPDPHTLVMSATPIPRTLAMTVFGDLDVTTIRGLPPGRTPITTRVVVPRQLDAVWQFVRSRIRAGEQVYVVYPIVEDSETLPLRAATSEFRRLAGGVFAGLPIGLLHGRMKPEEKDAVMADFAAGRTSVLVATTVIEVGIDVPNATVIVIQHANRYGLSQLHQLRGRVGRGARPGLCLLLADSEAEAQNARLSVLVQTTDGFKIAEEDLRLRGPGELLGTRQHGLPELRAADLVNDLDLLRQAQEDAAAMLRQDPELRDPCVAAIRRELAARYSDRMGLAGTA